MNRGIIGSGLACLVLLTACGPGLADNPSQPYATIRTYETRVAVLQGQLAVQSATLTAAGTPEPTATPPPFTKFWEVSIIGATQRKANVGEREGLEPLTAKGIFVVIPISVTNLQASPVYFIPTGALQLTDGSGRNFDVDPVASGAAYVLDFGYDPAIGPLQPGVATADVLVFDVSADATGLTLSATDRSLSIPLS